MHAVASVDDTIRRVIDALLARQHDDGSFRDFELGLGASATWVTAHVALRLDALPPAFRRDRVAAAVARARAFVERTPWSYNDEVGEDADTIAHALALCGGERERPERAAQLARHQRADGGFATFLPDARNAAYASWQLAHPDVTPVAVRALAPYRDDPAIADAISRARIAGERDREAGYPAFWWDLDWYTRAMWAAAGDALAAPFAIDLPDEPRARTPLDAAYLLDLACRARAYALADGLADAFLHAPIVDGLWSSSRVLRVTSPDTPRPWEKQGERGGVLYADVHRVYSGAVIVAALARYWS